MEEMGYRNLQLAWDAARAGRLGKESRGGLLTDDLALNMLTYMCSHTYDWPPTEDMRRKHVPCRYYKLGDKAMMADMGMTLIASFEDVQDADRYESLFEKRKASAVTRLKRSRKLLTERGLLKMLEKPNITGKSQTNAGYLLMIGDDKENAEVEAWAMECLRYRR